ncbi:MAG: CNP1-like family protein [Azonexus sp.]
MIPNSFNALRVLIVLALLGSLFLRPVFAEFDEDEGKDRDVKRWQEKLVELPAAPLQENLLPFYVSAATDNDFFVDGTSLTVGSDGVVRYVLVVQTAGGARNVSFEGLRCETRERRVYAFGRLDGTWSRSRNETWQRIRDVPANRHHAALYIDYFCPGGAIVLGADEALDALRRGGHPDNIVGGHAR